MRKCRFCTGAIEDAATVCPHCQRDLFPSRAAPPTPAPSMAAAESPQAIARVTVVDIDMPFASMVGFMIKWALAAIPAFLILTVIAAIVFFVAAVLGWFRLS